MNNLLLEENDIRDGVFVSLLEFVDREDGWLERLRVLRLVRVVKKKRIVNKKKNKMSLQVKNKMNSLMEIINAK